MPVTLDLTKAQPITADNNSGGVQLDLSQAQPIPAAGTQNSNPNNGSQTNNQQEGFGQSLINATPLGLLNQPDDGKNGIGDVVKKALDFSPEVNELHRVVGKLKDAWNGGPSDNKKNQSKASDVIDNTLSAIPLIGGLYQKALQQQSDDNIKGALGTAIGGLTSILAPDVIKGVGGASRSALNLAKSTASNAIESAYTSPAAEAAERQNIPLTTGRQAETGPVSMAERVIRRSGTEAEKVALQQADNQTAEATINKIQDLTDDIVKTPANATSKARAVSDLVNSAQDRAGEDYSDTMDHINSLTGGPDTPIISSDNTVKAIDDLTSKYGAKDSAEVIGSDRQALINKLQDYKQMFDPNTRQATLESAGETYNGLPTRASVSNSIKDLFRQLDAAGDGTEVIRARSVLRQAMKSDLEESLPPAFRSMHNEAITNYAKTMDAVDSGIGRSIINSNDPDLIAQHFAKPEFGDIPQSHLEQLIGKDNLPLVHGSLVEHLVQQAIPYDSGTFDGYTFARGLDKVNPKLLNTIPPDQLQALRNFASDVKRINLRDEARPADTQTGGASSPSDGVLKILAHGAGKIAIGGAGAVLNIAAKPLARMILNPRTSAFISRALRTSISARGAIPLTQRLMFLIHNQELRDGDK